MDFAAYIAGHGVAVYDSDRRRWVIEFDEYGVRYVPAGDRAVVPDFLCLGCRRDTHVEGPRACRAFCERATMCDAAHGAGHRSMRPFARRSSAQNQGSRPSAFAESRPLKLVAGAGFEPTTFGL